MAKRKMKNVKLPASKITAKKPNPTTLKGLQKKIASKKTAINKRVAGAGLLKALSKTTKVAGTTKKAIAKKKRKR